MDKIKQVDEKLDTIAVAGNDGRKRISCLEALKISTDCKVSADIVGKRCDDKNIRICNCQLTCFE
ncbi:MAG: hypothetical protein GX639_14930 [Fibrobacter sp.]|nr:hypothetical protein [Fibrobacter sp.]